jgi:hypothetical protein
MQDVEGKRQNAGRAVTVAACGIAAAAVILLAGCANPAYVAPQQTQSSAVGGQGSGVGGEVTLAGGEGTEVLVEGVAALTEGGADIARDHALKDALRKAVEQGVGTFVSSETRVQNFQLLSDRIYSQSSGYVSSYKVIAEEQQGGFYRVTIRAKVKLDKLEDDLAGIGILLEEQGRPRTMVVVKEVDNPYDFDVSDAMMSREMIETMLIDAFQQKGFPVVDQATVEQNLSRDQLKKILAGDNQAAALLGTRSGAEVVITGTFQRSQEQKTVPYSNTVADFYKVRLSTRAVNVANAAVMGASAMVRELPYSPDAAQRAAADSASAELISAILKGWKKHENVTEVHADNADYAKVQKFRAEVLAKVRGVKSVVSRDLTGTTAVLEIVSETSSQEVLDDLGAKKLAISFEVKEFAGNRIDIRFTDGGATNPGQ